VVFLHGRSEAGEVGDLSAEDEVAELGEGKEDEVAELGKGKEGR